MTHFYIMPFMRVSALNVYYDGFESFSQVFVDIYLLFVRFYAKISTI